MLFREQKSQLRIDDMPSSNKAATESLLYAALLTIAIGRKLLRTLQLRQNPKDKPRPTYPMEQWSILLRSVALQVLTLLLSPPEARPPLECCIRITLQHKAPDPNRHRMLLLERAQAGVLENDLAAA